MIEKAKKQQRTGLQRIWAATGYSMKGLKEAWSNEAAFRQELFIVILLTPVAFWLGQTMMQRALLILTLLIIVIVELLNSAIEAVVDRIGPERHKLSGQAKNMGSAAVMVSILAAVLIWTMTAWQKWIS